MKTIDLIYLFVLAALWGASYLFMRIAGPMLGSIVTMALRVSIAAATLWLYVYLARKQPDWRRHWKQFLILGALNNAIPFVLITNAVIDLNASMAAILNATTPLFTAVVAALWVKEAFGMRKGVGVLLGITGVTILMGWSPLPLNQRVILATLQAIIAAVSYGFAAVYARTRFQGIAPLHTAVGQLSGSSLLLVPLGVASAPAQWPGAHVVIAILGLALLSTALAYLIYFRLIASAGATQAATVTFLIPFFSVLWGRVFLKEPLNIGMFAGLGVILVSVWLVLGVQTPNIKKTRAEVLEQVERGS
ncbi:MAG: DMT family transporter [Caldilineaceae bacterium]|nr:DMT family transporter [Caldilineaceae bacterium]